MKFANQTFTALAIVLASVPLAAAPAAAQVVKGIGVVNLQAVVANSNAFRTAEQQRPVTYKPQIDQAEARRQQIAQQLQPMVNKFNTDRQAANPNQASLQQQAQTIQQIEQAGQRELQQILAPVALSEAYVEEQISDQINAAVQAAKARQKVTLVLTPQAVLSADTAYNMNQAVLDELNRLIPNAQLVPPQGWLPREIREQQAAAQQQGQAPAQPAGPQPEGR